MEEEDVQYTHVVSLRKTLQFLDIVLFFSFHFLTFSSLNEAELLVSKILASFLIELYAMAWIFSISHLALFHRENKCSPINLETGSATVFWFNYKRHQTFP
jgi:hypothetical protein